MKLQTALIYANRIVELLTPHCEKIHIAGSVRREKSLVKDIEILCQPKIHEVKDLFGNVLRAERSAFFTYAVTTFTEKVIKGKHDGRYMQILVKGNVTLDLFMPQPADYFRMLAIRTGSADYSHLVIADGWKRKGWCAVNGIGLRRIEDCVERRNGDKHSWVLSNPNGELPPVWQSEEEFFAWLGIPYTAPKNREIKETIKANQ